MAQVFNDSKTFVDMPIRTNTTTVLAAFSSLLKNTSKSGGPTATELGLFIETHFMPAGSEVVIAAPTDWTPSPSFLHDIADPKLREFGQSVHTKWRQLLRYFNVSDLCDECHSSIAVPNPFIIAGSRFREFYYWDSFWIIEGLLVSDMHVTARGMLLNMAYVIQKYGFMPNGGRIYYLNRSQPPLFTQMVDRYLLSTGDTNILSQVLPALDKEYQWWMSNRSVQVVASSGKSYTLAFYNVSNSTPRPESYYEDQSLASGMSPSDASFLYASLASAAESGQDFSTRWMPFNSVDLATIETVRIVPVDLNSILYKNEKSLAAIHFGLGNTDQYEYYMKQAKQRSSAIQEILWDAKATQWFDYHLDSRTLSSSFYTTNILPLWADIHKDNKHYFTPEILQGIVKSVSFQVMNYVGGVPTSTVASGQQWDFPNAWSPLQYWIIESLNNLDWEVSSSMAENLVERWVTTNYCGWSETNQTDSGVMFEKYDVENIGIPGGGGEYVVQTGFGWTNGVVLYLLQKYGKTLQAGSCT
eukprot:gene19160-22952_t